MLRGQSQEIQRATRSRTALVDKTAAANALPPAEKQPAKSAGRDEEAADDLVKNSALVKELTERATRAQAALAAAEKGRAAAEHARAESDATAEMLHQALAESEESCGAAKQPAARAPRAPRRRDADGADGAVEVAVGQRDEHLAELARALHLCRRPRLAHLSKRRRVARVGGACQDGRCLLYTSPSPRDRG